MGSYPVRPAGASPSQARSMQDGEVIQNDLPVFALWHSKRDVEKHPLLVAKPRGLVNLAHVQIGYTSNEVD